MTEGLYLGTITALVKVALGFAQSRPVDPRSWLRSSTRLSSVNTGGQREGLKLWEPTSHFSFLLSFLPVPVLFSSIHVHSSTFTFTFTFPGVPSFLPFISQPSFTVYSLLSCTSSFPMLLSSSARLLAARNSALVVRHHIAVCYFCSHGCLLYVFQPSTISHHSPSCLPSISFTSARLLKPPSPS